MNLLFLLVFFAMAAPIFGVGGSMVAQTLRFTYPSAVVEVPLPATIMQKIKDNGYLQQLQMDIESLLAADNPLLWQTQMLQLVSLRKAEHEMLLASYAQAEEHGFSRDWQDKFDHFGAEKIFPWLKSGFIGLSENETSRVMLGYPHTLRELRYRYARLMELKTDFYREMEEIHKSILHALWRSSDLAELFGAEAHLQIGQDEGSDFWKTFRQNLDQDASNFSLTKAWLSASWQIKSRLQKLRQARPQDAQEMLFLAQLAQATVDTREAGMLVAMYRAAVLEQEELLHTNQGKSMVGFSVAELWKDLYILQHKTGRTLDAYVLNSAVAQ